MAFFEDPDGNALMLHHRYAPKPESTPYPDLSPARQKDLTAGTCH